MRKWRTRVIAVVSAGVIATGAFAMPVLARGAGGCHNRGARVNQSAGTNQGNTTGTGNGTGVCPNYGTGTACPNNGVCDGTHAGTHASTHAGRGCRR